MAATRRVSPGKRRAAPPAEGPSVTAQAMEPACFRGIDLVVWSRSSVASLVAALPRAYQPLNLKGRPMAGLLVLNSISINASAEVESRRLLKQLEALKGAARHAWRLAHRRVFDLGIQAGSALPPFEEVLLTPETLGRIAALGVRIQVTVYPPEADIESQIAIQGEAQS